MFSLLYNITTWCESDNNYSGEELFFSDRELTRESRNILDKIAITMLKCEVDNAIIIDGLLRLSKMERIIIILNILNDIALFEIAFLLDTNLNSIYVQKKSALKKLEKEFSKHFHYGIIKYKEVEIT